MDTDKFKSIAIPIEAYKKLMEMSDKRFEMPQSLAIFFYRRSLQRICKKSWKAKKLN